MKEYRGKFTGFAGIDLTDMRQADETTKHYLGKGMLLMLGDHLLQVLEESGYLWACSNPMRRAD